MSTPHTFFALHHKRIFAVSALLRDHFITRGLEQLTLEEALDRHLRHIGYEAVLFVGHDRVYFYDPNTNDIINSAESTSPTRALNPRQGAALKGGARAPLGGRRRLGTHSPTTHSPTPPATPDASPPAAQASRGHFIPFVETTMRRLSLLIQQNKHHIAVVFVDGRRAEQLISNEMIISWKQLSPTNRNIVILCWDERLLGEAPPPVGAELIQLTSPNTDELVFFLNRYRLTRNAQIENWQGLKHLAACIARALRGSPTLEERSLISLEVRLNAALRQAELERVPLTLSHQLFSEILRPEFPTRDTRDALTELKRRDCPKDPIRGVQQAIEWLERLTREQHTTRSATHTDLPARLTPSPHRHATPPINNLLLSVIGPQGAGKLSTTRLLTRALAERELVSSGHLTQLTAEEIHLSTAPAALINERLTESLGGALIIHSPYNLPPHSGLRELFINTLTHALDTPRPNSHDPLCVFLSGSEVGLRELIEESRLREHFRDEINLESFSTEQLCRCVEVMCEDLALTLESTLRAALPALIEDWARRANRAHTFANGESVERLIQQVQRRRVHRHHTSGVSDSLVKYEDFPPLERSTQQTADEAHLDDLIGLKAVKEVIYAKRRLMEYLIKARQEQAHNTPTPAPGHYLFMGNPGTGKTTVARLMGHMFHEIGLLRRGHLVEVSRSQLVAEWQGGTAIKTRQRLEEALDGVLFIDEAYQLNQGEQDSFGREASEAILAFMENHRQRLCVILAGYTAPLQQLLKTNPGFESRIGEENMLLFEDYTPSELIQMMEQISAQQRLTLSSEARGDLTRVIQRMHALKPSNFGNARDIRRLIERLSQRRAVRLSEDPESPKTLIREDIPPADRAFLDVNSRSVEVHLRSLDALTGLTRVKQVLRKKAHLIQRQLTIADTETRPLPPGHYVFLGNPGTGKTTVARLLGHLLKSLGALQKGHVVEVTRAQLVAPYVGQTSLKTTARLEEALDGVLFIDEAYQLNQGEQDSFGREALETLLTFMENNRHRLSVVLAGYTAEMNQLLRLNPGFESRIGSEGRVYFDDFTPSELYDILKADLTRDEPLDLQGAEAPLRRIIERTCRLKGEDFGNARVMRDLAQEIIALRAQRHARSPQLTEEDIPPTYLRLIRQSPQDTTRALQKINALTGLQRVKARMTEKLELLRLNLLRADSALVTPGHYVFLGNPGTGKTTVARLFGEALCSLGALSRGHVIEVSRSDLVAGYAGQTSAKTTEKLREALDGVLFIDEAYQLQQGDHDSFGREALETLLAFMENHRHRLCVILAGYTAEMSQLLNSNPGFESRIERQDRLHFEDYRPEELTEIFEALTQAEGYTLTPTLIEEARRVITRLYATRDERFGNAREMRNLFSGLKSSHAQRVLSLPAHERDAQLNIFAEPDLPTEYKSLVRQSSEGFEVALSRLNALTGLRAVKRVITDISALLKLNIIEGEGLVEPGHYTFIGNPGTGKTTVARLFGDIFKSLGVLRRGHVVEVGRSDLVAGYVGQTSLKTRERLEAALDGVLFVDEAYQLDGDQFGLEALNEILAFMENQRHRLCVIFAGYPTQIAQLLQRNPGFSSRISAHVPFEDFTSSECVEIFSATARGEGFSVEERCAPLLSALLEERRGKDFGNARAARELFAEVKRARARRLFTLPHEEIIAEGRVIRPLDLQALSAR